jgi:SAM-dependent methyltransferase
MENTGERHIPGSDFIDQADYYIHLLHIASYEYALQFATGKKVLDYGCGSGYGSHMLSQKAESVVAVDISREAVEYAIGNFTSDNLTYKEVKDLDAQKYDLITSFQVIEHVTDDARYILQLKGLLNPGGTLLLTTPDKTHRLFNYIQKPWNIYHLKEYSTKSMDRLLIRYFDDYQILQITSKPEFVLPEITRRKKQRLVTLPCTLFFYPDFLRVYLLQLQTKFYKTLIKYRNKNNNQELTGLIQKESSFSKYTSRDIEISKDTELPTDLFVICRI